MAAREQNYGQRMIKSFRCRDTEAIANDESVRRFQSIERVARRKLEMLASAERLEDLNVPPGNRLEALKGDRAGQHSVRINRQWRICFRWDDGAGDVEIVDYH
jgi:toxin HigB-1